MTPALDPLNLAELLFQQQLLTAVDRFSQRHDGHASTAQAKYYRDLLPLTEPREGAREQYAFEVDLDQCSGCKACVTACHTLNGLEEDESWRSVGLLHGGTVSNPFQQTVTTACHHCLDPACLSGCPVLAYDKDPLTGIVRHLDDQCIGCQYCVWQCPYQVPRYSQRLGIVRKCDLCSHRLAAHEAPACVQSCPNQAISISIVHADDVLRQTTATSSLVPGAPLSHRTLPTTQYLSSRARPDNAGPANAHQLQPEPAHWPLVFMLVLTQMGIGLELAALVLRWTDPVLARVLGPSLTLAALGSVGIGLLLGMAHLGQPLRAWRAFLGLRTSWLSREIVLFGILIPFLALHALTEAWPGLLDSWLGPKATAPLLAWLNLAVAGLGGLAVFTSIMIYHDTGRAFWHVRLGMPKFVGTTALLGLAGLWSLLAISATQDPERSALILGLAAAVAALGLTKLAWEYTIMGRWKHHSGLPSPATPAPGASGLMATAQLLAGPLQAVWRWRLVAGFLGGVFLPVAFLGLIGWMPHTPDWAMTAPIGCISLLAAGELAERYLFFTAVTMPRMPGGVV